MMNKYHLLAIVSFILSLNYIFVFLLAYSAGYIPKFAGLILGPLLSFLVFGGSPILSFLAIILGSISYFMLDSRKIKGKIYAILGIIIGFLSLLLFLISLR